MAEPMAFRISRAIETVSALYHRLVLLVGPAGSGNTPAIKRAIINDPCAGYQQAKVRIVLE